MRFLLRLILVLSVLGGMGYATSGPVRRYFEQRNRPEFRTEAITLGDAVSVVEATGKVKASETVSIGTFVSGPISELPPHIDFNTVVSKGELLARVDPRLYQARMDADQAALDIAQAEIKRVEAQLQQARNNEKRAQNLREKRADFVSDQEMDQLRFGRMQLEAALLIAETSVKQATANLDNSKANFDFTYIKAPKDGIIILRNAEEGKTLAATFQTPELFQIGVGMREAMHIYASVDENDIGLITAAQATKQPVQFTVSAYPDELFHGEIIQVRMSSTETQAVITYPVIVKAANPDLKLLPGMTAYISFQIEERKQVVLVPNAALRFYPERIHVRPEDHAILDGSDWTKAAQDETSDERQIASAEKRTAARKQRNQRHVWIEDQGKLRAIPIEIGVSDQREGRVTEVRSGALKPGDPVVIGIKKKPGIFGK